MPESYWWFLVGGVFVPQSMLGNVWRHFLFSYLDGGELLASVRKGPRMLLNNQQNTGLPLTRMIYLTTSVMLD
jgi:hypothetical protein